MGLDTTSYRNFKLRPDLTEKASSQLTEEEEEEFENYRYDNCAMEAFAYKEFPHALEGFGVKPWIDTAFPLALTVGYVQGEPGPMTHAGYVKHSIYRDTIAEFFGEIDGTHSDMSRDMPFYDLLWFADNEGTLGPASCKRLLEAYDTFDAELLVPDRLADYHNQWHEAVKWAAQDGFIDFH